MELDTNKLIFYALLAAVKAGEKILEVYSSKFYVEKKADDSPLTLADTSSHETIDLILKRQFTYIPLLSEEGKEVPYETRRGWKYIWLVDPLDGTKDFLKRNDEFTVNIALVQKNRPVLGIIYIPVADTVYYGMEEGGSYKKIAVKESFGELDNTDDGFLDRWIESSQSLPLYTRRDTEKLIVVKSRSHQSIETDRYILRLQERFGDVKIVSAGSSIKFCLVAEGKADIYPRFGPTMEWDTAAGDAIIQNAGGGVVSVTNWDKMKYNKKDLKNPGFIAFSKRIEQCKIFNI